MMMPIIGGLLIGAILGDKPDLVTFPLTCPALWPRIYVAGEGVYVSAYSSILGHERPIALLERARKSGRVAHALLFAGPDGVGKELVAFAFAKALNCKQPDPPCGECDSCTKIERGNHPDVRLVACEQELIERGRLEAEKARVPSTQIRIAQLDELAGLFRHRPYLGGWKVVIVVDADRMNTSSQNRFLKTLEEPSSDSVIILVTAHPEALLPTVRSRCQMVSFGPLARGQMAEFLTESRGVASDRAEVLAAMAQGSLGRALQYAKEDGILETRDRLLTGLARATEGDLADVLDLARQHGNQRPVMRETLDLLEVLFRDLLLCRLELPAEFLINRDVDRQIHKEAQRFSKHRLSEIISQIRQSRRDLEVNVNPLLATESLLIDMRTN
jgi:DNA polymerase-3 subunit delta'